VSVSRHCWVIYKHNSHKLGNEL